MRRASLRKSEQSKQSNRVYRVSPIPGARAEPTAAPRGREDSLRPHRVPIQGWTQYGEMPLIVLSPVAADWALDQLEPTVAVTLNQ